MLQQHRPSASHKHTSPTSNGVSGSIRSNLERGAKIRKRGRPVGTIPARIARVELGIEALAAIDEDERVFKKCRRALNILEHQEAHVCIEYGIRHAMTASAYADARIRIKESRKRVIAEMEARERKLHDTVRPELLNLCTQADRNAA